MHFLNKRISGYWIYALSVIINRSQVSLSSGLLMKEKELGIGSYFCLSVVCLHLVDLASNSCRVKCGLQVHAQLSPAVGTNPSVFILVLSPPAAEMHIHTVGPSPSRLGCGTGVKVACAWGLEDKEDNWHCDINGLTYSPEQQLVLTGVQ